MQHNRIKLVETTLNYGVLWLVVAIATDVLSTFLSAKGNGLEDKVAQFTALALYVVSFAACAIALKYMKAGILYVLWSGVGVVAVAMLSKYFLGQHIDKAGWFGITLIVVGVGVISQWSDLDV